MDSSLIERSIEKQRKTEIHRDFHSPQQNQEKRQKENPSCRDQNQNIQPSNQRDTPRQDYRQLFIEAIRKRELLRAEREEEIRRELAVGTGPELRRS